MIVLERLETFINAKNGDERLGKRFIIEYVQKRVISQKIKKCRMLCIDLQYSQ